MLWAVRWVVGGAAGSTGTGFAGRGTEPLDGARFPHLPALDGLRGVAVALVVAYHLSPDLVPGGFLGVDVFFVLSGFLIASLLVEEVGTSGSIRIGRFFVRRVRRLAPALLLVVLALAVYAEVWATPGELTRIREHSLWTLGYLANWELIADGTTYTDVVAGQSPLRHAWSLAIEEQFYVAFPLAVVLLGAAVGWQRKRLRRALLAVAGLGAAVSAAWMAVLWDGGGDVARGYFGTDTRAHSLLVGVALGALLVGRPPVTGRAAAVAARSGTVGVVVLAAAVAVANEDDAWLQQGGFLLVALATAAVISSVERFSPLGRALRWRPLVGLGVISYGVYLWHWPIVVLVDAGRTGLDGWSLAALRLAATLAAALTSYVVVERPIRSGALSRLMGRVSVVVAPSAVAATAAVVLVATALPSRPRPSAAEVPAMPLPEVVDVSSPIAPPPRLVLFGDSVAHTMAGGTVGDFPSFEPWSPELSPVPEELAQVWSVAKPACSFLPGGLVLPGSPPADLSGFCGRWQDDLAAALGAWPGASVVVALANDASDRRLGDRDVLLGSDEHEALVAALLDEIRGLTETAGGELVLVALPPRVGVAATEQDRHGQRERRMREVLLDYGRRHPEARVLDLFSVVCPDGDCDRPVAGFESSWRYDGMHLTTEGARWVLTWLATELSP